MLKKENKTPWEEVEATITGTEVKALPKVPYCVYVSVHFDYEDIDTLDTTPVDTQLKPLRNCSSAKWVAESILTRYPVGKQLIIRVDPGDLTEVRPQKHSLKQPYVFIALGICLFLLSIYITFIPLKESPPDS